MATKIITIDQLAQIADWVRSSFVKVSTDAVLSSVTVGNIKLSEDNGRLKVEDITGSKGTVYIALPDAEEEYSVVLNGQNTSVSLPSLTVDSISCGTYYDTPVYYCLPTSSQDARSAAAVTSSNGGGGCITTTRYGAVNRVTHDLAAPQSLRVYSGVYTEINIISSYEDDPISFNLSLEGSDTGFLAEYWIEVNNANRCSGINLYGFGGTVWTPEEPEWMNLPTDRMLIHIINGIAMWHAVPTEGGSQSVVE